MDETRDIILKSARKVFERFGFNKTSMNDIAIAAKKGRRTLYMHFSGKEAVFKAVIEKEVFGVAASLQQIIDSDILPDEKLRRYMHTRMNAIKKLTMYYDALRQDLVNNLGLIENLRKEYDEKETVMIQSILDEGVKAQIFEIDDTGLVAMALVLATKGFELPIYTGQTNYDHNKLIDPLIKLFYRGLIRTG